MDIEGRFLQILEDSDFLQTMATHLLELPEEFVSEELLDSGFDPSLLDAKDFCRGRGFREAVSRIADSMQMSGPMLKVYRGTGSPPATLQDEASYSKKNGRRTVPHVSYSLSRESAMIFTRGGGSLISGLVGENDIVWKHFLYLHLVYPACAALELEVPVIPGRTKIISVEPVKRPTVLPWS